MARKRDETGEQADQPVWVFTANRLPPDDRPERFFPDIPSRDLLQADIDALSDEQRGRALESGLYRPSDQSIPETSETPVRPGQED